MSDAIVLSVPKMMCNGCVNTITTALKDKAGAEQVECDLDTKIVKVIADYPVADVIAVIKDAGYDATSAE